MHGLYLFNLKYVHAIIAIVISLSLLVFALKAMCQFMKILTDAIKTKDVKVVAFNALVTLALFAVLLLSILLMRPIEVTERIIELFQ